MLSRHRTRVLGATVFLAGVAVAASFGLAGRGEAAPQVIPANTVPPVISGEATVDRTLTASPGTWTGTTPLSFTYAWQRCDATGGSCAVVTGATTPSYPLESADVGSTLRVVVTATNSDGAVSSTSVPTGVVRRTNVAGCPPVQQAGRSTSARSPRQSA